MKAKKQTRSTKKAQTQSSQGRDSFTKQEREAMKERSAEVKTERRRGASSRADGESDVLAKIAEMSEPDRRIAERIHAIVKTSAPSLSPKTWYGMPAYARGDDVICFFQNAGKFKTRYSTLGFSDKANLDDGSMWPTSFALAELAPAVELRIASLIKKAAG